MNLLLGALLTCKAFAVARQGMAESSLHAQDAILDGYKDMPEHAALKLGPASIAEVDHTTVAHSAFPKHSVRITRVRDFCDTTIKTYSGYVDVEARHLFFYFFESRSKPETDDVMMWINGGPGVSSSIGMLMEVGPCNIESANSTTFNPYAWNKNANMIFLDQPVGVGFSYADHGETMYTSEEAAKDVAAFFAILFNSFPQYKSRALHLSGESYGGRYIPLFAAEIYDQNSRLVQMGMDPVNLSSIVLVNGWTDMYLSTESYYEMQCTSASGLPPVMSIATCVRMKQALPRCLEMLRENCYTIHDEMNCMAANNFCQAELFHPYVRSGRNPYDVSKRCNDESADTLCQPEAKAIVAFLNSSTTREAIGTDPLPTIFTLTSPAVLAAFAGDQLRDAAPYVGQLLDRGVRVLVLAGAYDIVCSWVGNERMTRTLAWHGQESFGAEALREWEVDGEKAGMERSWGALAFASVYGAGHMAPHDKPKETLALISRWLAGDVL